MMVIYDFGCHAGLSLAQFLSAFGGAVACITLFAGLAVLGRGLVRDTVFSVTHIITGWAIAAILMTFMATCFPSSLAMTSYGLFAVMMVALVFVLRKKYFATPFWCAVFFPGLLILIAINNAGIAKWDDFSHWVLNALYLTEYDSLPRHDFPAPFSVWPGYPYALPFLTYLTSKITGGFVMQGGAMFNFLFLLAFAGALVELYKDADRKPFNGVTLTLMGGALLAVTIFNPSFNASFTMTSQGDGVTMVVVGFLAILLWRLIDALKQHNVPEIRKLVLTIMLANALLLLIKQGNLALFGLLLISFWVVAWKNHILKPALLYTPVMVILAYIMRMLWQHYVDREMAGNGFPLHPIHEWRFDLLGSLLRSIGHEMLKKNGQTFVMLATLAGGTYALFRPTHRLGNFFILASGVYVGYLAFLIAAYLGTNFNSEEIARAASFYRYSTHAGLIGLTALWLAAPVTWVWVKDKYTLNFPAPSVLSLRVMVIASFVALPCVAALAPSALVAQPSNEICTYRAQGAWLALQLPSSTRLAVVDPEGDGMFSFVVMFELALSEALTGQRSNVTWQVNQFTADHLEDRLQQLRSMPTVDAIMVQRARRNFQTIQGYSNQETEFLLKRTDGGWSYSAP